MTGERFQPILIRTARIKFLHSHCLSRNVIFSGETSDLLSSVCSVGSYVDCVGISQKPGATNETKGGGGRRQRVDLIYNSKQYQMICELWVECTRLRLTNDELEKIPANVNAGAVLV